MKSSLAIFLTLCMLILCFAGCSNTADKDNSSDTTGATSATQSEAESKTEAETESKTDSEAESSVNTSSDTIITTKYKKYFTIRMDDLITQDARVIEILKKYNARCITFYGNSGLFGTSWEWVGQNAGRPDVTHIRYKLNEFANVYRGYDIAVHTKNHRHLIDCTDAEVTEEVESDRKFWENVMGRSPVGMAWPGGDNCWNDHSIETVLNTTGVRFGSCTTSTYSFALPQYFMKWYPTCAVNDSQALTLAQKFIDAVPTEDMLFYIWGHGYDLDIANAWDNFEQLVKMITEAAAKDDSIVLVTNTEFYELYKDKIPVWK